MTPSSSPSPARSRVPDNDHQPFAGRSTRRGPPAVENVPNQLRGATSRDKDVTTTLKTTCVTEEGSAGGLLGKQAQVLLATAGAEIEEAVSTAR